jgi:hypothetical protein
MITPQIAYSLETLIAGIGAEAMRISAGDNSTAYYLMLTAYTAGLKPAEA